MINIFLYANYAGQKGLFERSLKLDACITIYCAG